MKRILRKIRRDEKGETVMISTFLILCFVLFLVLCAIEVFSLAIEKQHVDYTARAIARTLEEQGYVSSSIDTYFNTVSDSLGLSDAEYEVINDRPYIYSSEVGSGKCIQFNDTFKIKVTSTYEWKALPLRDMTVSADVSGRSSVYWK